MATALKEIPDIEKFRNKLTKKIEPVEFEPTEILKRLDIPESSWFKFLIKPLNYAQNARVETDKRIASQMAMKWANENGIAPETLAKEANVLLDGYNGKKTKHKSTTKGRIEYNIYSSKMASLLDVNLYREIARENISGITGDIFIFEDDGKGSLSKNVFESIHDDIIESIAGEIIRISNLSSAEMVGL